MGYDRKMMVSHVGKSERLERNLHVQRGVAAAKADVALLEFHLYTSGKHVEAWA